MVIVQLIGGLGNQMFQYAAGRALALHHRTALKLDISAFAGYPLRTYRLHHLRIHEDFATPQEVAAVQAGGAAVWRGGSGRCDAGWGMCPTMPGQYIANANARHTSSTPTWCGRGAMST